jgi:hypothetical protein
LLEALSGAADLDQDGKVTVLEAFQYLSAKVRDYTLERFQIAQQPVLEVRGMSGEIVLTHGSAGPRGAGDRGGPPQHARGDGV